MGQTSPGAKRQRTSREQHESLKETSVSNRHSTLEPFAADSKRTYSQCRRIVWNRAECKWYAKQDGEENSLGPFDSEEGAAKAWYRYAVENELWDKLNMDDCKLVNLFECNNYSQRRSVVSKFRGVTFNKPVNKWQAQVWHDGRNRSLGHFMDEVTAARAYDKFALHCKLFGRLNFDDYTIADVKRASACSPFADVPPRTPAPGGRTKEKVTVNKVRSKDNVHFSDASQKDDRVRPPELLRTKAITNLRPSTFATSAHLHRLNTFHVPLAKRRKVVTHEKSMLDS